jgi:hypothetical protein
VLESSSEENSKAGTLFIDRPYFKIIAIALQ